MFRDRFSFALLRSVISKEESSHLLNQSDSQAKPVATWSLIFSRALGSLLVFTLCSHWHSAVITDHVSAKSNLFVFVFVFIFLLFVSFNVYLIILDVFIRNCFRKHAIVSVI